MLRFLRKRPYTSFEASMNVSIAVRVAVASAALSLASCKPPMPPAGTARLYVPKMGFDALQPQQYGGTFEVTWNVDYAGARKILEQQTEVWVHGTLSGKPDTSRQVN